MKPTTIAICEFVMLDGDETQCYVSLPEDGWEFPRVSFPPSYLAQNGLRPGDWFAWRVDNNNPTNPDTDIWKIDKPSDEMSYVDKLRLERLYAEHKNYDDEPWPEYMGDGE